jgi:hypothetical protein
VAQYPTHSSATNTVSVAHDQSEEETIAKIVHAHKAASEPKVPGARGAHPLPNPDATNEAIVLLLPSSEFKQMFVDCESRMLL